HSASMVCPVWSMRISRDIGKTSWGRWWTGNATPELSGSQALQDHPPDLPAIGPALCLAHHVADQRPDRLHVVGPDLLGGAGVAGKRLLDEPLELTVFPSQGQETLALC